MRKSYPDLVVLACNVTTGERPCSHSGKCRPCHRHCPSQAGAVGAKNTARVCNASELSKQRSLTVSGLLLLRAQQIGIVMGVAHERCLDAPPPMSVTSPAPGVTATAAAAAQEFVARHAFSATPAMRVPTLRPRCSHVRRPPKAVLGQLARILNTERRATLKRGPEDESCDGCSTLEKENVLRAFLERVVAASVDVGLCVDFGCVSGGGASHK